VFAACDNFCQFVDLSVSSLICVLFNGDMNAVFYFVLQLHFRIRSPFIVTG